MTHIYCSSFEVLLYKSLPMVFMSGCSSFPQSLLALSFHVLWPAGPQRAKSTVFKRGFPCSLARVKVLYYHVLVILLDFKTVPRLLKKLKVQPQDRGLQFRMFPQELESHCAKQLTPLLRIVLWLLS